MVTLASVLIAFPLAYYIARFASPRGKALLYLAVVLPLWSSYLIRVYSWKLILAKEGIVSWFASVLHVTWLLDFVLGLPIVGGPSLSVSALGTFLAFVYVWLPYMILPIVAALERVPTALIEASADLGASWPRTLASILVPLTLPGIAAGSVFVFVLSIGNFITPDLLGGGKSIMVGNLIYDQFLTARDWPFGSALAFLLMAIMLLLLLAQGLLVARGQGAR